MTKKSNKIKKKKNSSVFLFLPSAAATYPPSSFTFKLISFSSTQSYHLSTSPESQKKT